MGKSCLLHQFTEKKCAFVTVCWTRLAGGRLIISNKNIYLRHLLAVMADCPHTIGVEFGTRIIEVCGQKIKLQIWFVGYFLLSKN